MSIDAVKELQLFKVCRSCGETKPIEKFTRHKLHKDGYDTLCLVCNVERVTTKRKENIKRGIKRNYEYRPKTSDSWRKAIIDFLIKRDGFICGICKESLENSKIHIDHIIPYALGGKCTLENMQLAHQKCNTKVGAKIRNTKISGYEY